MNGYELGVGIVSGLALVSWIASLEVRFRIARNQAIMAKQAEVNAKFIAAESLLSDAERIALAERAVERYSKD